MTDLETRIFDIIARETKRDRATLGPDTPISQIESLDLVQVIFAIESEFGIYIPADDDRYQLKTLRDVVEGVRALVAEKEAGSPASA